MRAWQRLSAGAGAKGERYYDWAQVDIQHPAGRPGRWCLLVRRNLASANSFPPLLLTPAGCTV